MVKELKWKADPADVNEARNVLIEKSQDWENSKVNEFLHDNNASPETHRVTFLNNTGAEGVIVTDKYYTLLPKDYDEVGETMDELMWKFPTLQLVFDYSI